MQIRSINTFEDLDHSGLRLLSKLLIKKMYLFTEIMPGNLSSFSYRAGSDFDTVRAKKRDELVFRFSFASPSS